MPFAGDADKLEALWGRLAEDYEKDTGKGKVFYTLKFYSEDKLIDIFVFINKDEREKYFKGLLFSLSNKNKLIKLE